MKYLSVLPVLFIMGCAGFQGAMDDVEKIADNDAIVIKVDKDAFHDDTNVHVNIDVVNDASLEQSP